MGQGHPRPATPAAGRRQDRFWHHHLDESIPQRTLLALPPRRAAQPELSRPRRFVVGALPLSALAASALAIVPARAAVAAVRAALAARLHGRVVNTVGADGRGARACSHTCHHRRYCRIGNTSRLWPCLPYRHSRRLGVVRSAWGAFAAARTNGGPYPDSASSVARAGCAETGDGQFLISHVSGVPKGGV